MKGCAHRWEVVKRSYTPSPIKSVDGRMTQATMMALTFGVTTIEQRCRNCGRTELETTPGDAR